MASTVTETLAFTDGLAVVVNINAALAEAITLSDAYVIYVPPASSPIGRILNPEKQVRVLLPVQVNRILSPLPQNRVLSPTKDNRILSPAAQNRILS
jgi:hypothetical protein